MGTARSAPTERRRGALPCLFARSTALRAVALTVALGVVALAGTARALDGGVLSDEMGHLEIADVVGRAFEPFGSTLARGYSDSAYWLRLTVPAGAGDVVRIRPAYLDDIRVYLPAPATDTGWHEVLLGDRAPRAASSVRSMAHNALLPERDAPVDVYLRIASTSAVIAAVDVVDVETLRRSDVDVVTLLLVVVAVTFAAIGRVSAVSRSGVAAGSGALALFALSGVAFGASVVGTWRWLLPDHAVTLADPITSVSIMLLVFAGYAFHYRTLPYFAAPRWLVKTALAMAALPVVAALVWVGVDQRAGLMTNAAAGLALPPLATAAAVFVRSSIGPPLALVRAAFALLAVLITGHGVALLTDVLDPLVMMTAPLLAPMVGGGLMVWLVARRVEAERAAAVENEGGRALAEQSLRFERDQRASTERFVGMLAHELRSPLSVVTMTLGAVARGQVPSEPALRRADAALRDADAVLERCLVAARMDRGAVTLELERIELRPCLEEVVAMHPAGERIDLSVDDVRVVIDQRALCHIVSNLIDNALAYGAPDERVALTCRREHTAGGPLLTLRVRNAIGPMGTPDPKRAFDRYHRGARAGAVTGAGLGLHLVRSFAEALGGTASLGVVDDAVEAGVIVPC